jgi:Cu(I)/Ag(I) efflux system periplasmic protein CusF
MNDTCPVLQEKPMFSLYFRSLLFGLAPIALAACVEIEPATGLRIATAPLVGTDLGSWGRVPQIAGLAGEGEGYGRTEPNPSPVGHMDHGSIDHGSMPGMKRGPKDRASGMTHGAAGMHHDSPKKMASAHGTMSGAKPRSGARDTQMAHSGHAHVRGTGTVNSVDVAARKLNVTHAPIPAIGWPSMTMDFAVAPGVDLSAVKPGTRIRFDMEQGQGGTYVIQSIAPAGGGRQ